MPAKGLTKKQHRRVFGRLTSHRKRLVRYGILTANLLILAGVLWFVLNSSKTTSLTSQTALLTTTNSDEAISPLDQLSSADIAVNVARVTNLDQATSAANQADSANILLSIAPTSEAIIDKPQIVATSLKSIKDLQQYVTQPGDTVSSLASKFGITSDSIRWSNSLTGNDMANGITLWIPPVEGIVYVVRPGDTVGSLANTYNTSKESIIAFNDIEISGLRVNQRIVIPGGSKITGGTGTGTGAVSASAGLAFIGSPSGGYSYGFCTYYAAAKAGVPGGWGNANTWHLYAPMSGWTVSTVPRVGAVAQTSSGWGGHVGIVEAVKQSGGQYYIKYSDMNGLAGWNRVGYSDWVPAIGRFQRFIYH